MTLKATAAFAEYVAMGDGRSLEKLAEARVSRKLARSVPSSLNVLKRWSARYCWQERIRSTTTQSAQAMLEEAAELDADTFLKTSRIMNQTVNDPRVDPLDIIRIRESVRRPQAKNVASIDVRHTGTIKHAHHDMSHFTDDEIDTLAAIAERHKAEVTV